MINRYYYSDSIQGFCQSSLEEILGELAKNNEFELNENQRNAWLSQITILQKQLNDFSGKIFFEYSIPRVGGRIDVVLLISNIIFVLEFKTGTKNDPSFALDQVYDYALDLKNFHETSQDATIVPLLIVPHSKNTSIALTESIHADKVICPIKVNIESIPNTIKAAINNVSATEIDIENWHKGHYSPTPTIIEAARSLYNNHSVEDISRSDATAINLSKTSNAISNAISQAKLNNEKVICFVTGVPGAGKTLVGLDIATKQLIETNTHGVYLSGNGPLVAVLKEALTKDRVNREKAQGNKIKKGVVKSAVKSMIQNIHHFRDEALKSDQAPSEHIAIFDEAQRAWNLEQTANFMSNKRKQKDFGLSEPEFLISYLNRHNDWAVIVCLVGGGQEINKGEAGISEWIDSLNRSFPNWKIFISSRLTDSEYATNYSLKELTVKNGVVVNEELHLSVSLRSFRAEHLSGMIKNILDLNIDAAKEDYQLIKEKYPIALTRDLSKAKDWLRIMARGSERYGIVVSSQAQRLKPFAIDVNSPIDPVHWFLNEKDDVRSSFFLEDVATEFHIQGLELDWVCIVWDGDFRYTNNGWAHHSFKGSKWQNINSKDRQMYLKNAYRVLLTRARQGMVIVVPNGNQNDPTRDPQFYDETFNYLLEIGFPIL